MLETMVSEASWWGARPCVAKTMAETMNSIAPDRCKPWLFCVLAPLACLLMLGLPRVGFQGEEEEERMLAGDLPSGAWEVPVFVSNLRISKLTRVGSRTLPTGKLPEDLDLRLQEVMGVTPDGTILISEYAGGWTGYEYGYASKVRAVQLNNEHHREWTVPSDRQSNNSSVI